MKRFLFRLAVIAPIAGGMAICAAQSTPTSQPTTMASAVAITWDQAKSHVDETVSVTGPVVGKHQVQSGAMILNIGKDFPDPDRFTVFIPAEQQDGLPADDYVGKTVTVTGKVKLFKDVPEIVAGTKDIQVAGGSTGAGATTNP